MKMMDIGGTIRVNYEHIQDMERKSHDILCDCVDTREELSPVNQ